MQKINTLSAFTHSYKDLIASKLTDFFSSFIDSSYLFSPIGYNVSFYPIYNIKGGLLSNVDILFYSPPSVWLTNFSDTLPFSDLYKADLSLPHRYTMMSLRIRSDPSVPFSVMSAGLRSDFICFKKSEEEIYKTASSVPLSNHLYTNICTNYTIGSVYEDFFSYYEDLFSDLLSSRYNTDYFNMSVHYSRSGYLLLKYLDFPGFSDKYYYSDILNLSDLSYIAKRSDTYIKYVEKVKPYARRIDMYWQPKLDQYPLIGPTVSNYESFISAWQTKPEIWSEIPDKEYRFYAFRNQFLSPAPLRTDHRSANDSLIPFFHSPVIYDIKDLLSTLNN